MDDSATKKDLETGLQSVRDEIRAIGVIVERTDANVRLLAEALVVTRDELKRDVADLRIEMTTRFETVESAVRQNSADIRDIAASRS